jgi:hypothetical protein
VLQKLPEAAGTMRKFLVHKGSTTTSTILLLLLLLEGQGGEGRIEVTAVMRQCSRAPLKVICSSLCCLSRGFKTFSSKLSFKTFPPAEMVVV